MTKIRWPIWCIFCFWGCVTANSEQPIVPFKVSPVKVEAVAVKSKPLAYSILTEGVVQVGKTQELVFEKSGRLMNVRAVAGSHVSSGDTLAIIENRMEKLALEAAVIRLKEASYTYESEIMPFRQTDHLTDTVRNSIWYASGKASAEVTFKQQKFALEKTFLTAEMSGILSSLKLKEGKFIQAGEVLGRIYSPSSILVEAYVLELHYGTIDPGMPVALVDINGREIPGRVVHIDPEVDTDGFFKIGMTPDNSGFVPGMHVGVKILLKIHQGIAIPARAIMKKSDRLVVYVARKGMVSWQYIVAGRQIENDIEIIGGLVPGDTIVLNRLSELDHGVPIDVNLLPED